METPGIPGASAGTSSSEPVHLTASYDDEARQVAIVAGPISKAPLMSVDMPQFQPADVLGKEIKSGLPRLQDDNNELDSLPSPRLRSSRIWKFRGPDLLNEKRERKKPLSLLDLPVDVLKEIVREVTHTNDLTSLALCHSALHRLAIPHIYSRFDIVWPDTNTHAEPRSGVDALTYGLATLVMAEEIFGEAPAQRRDHANRFTKTGTGRATEMTVRKRRGNHYAQYTKKFSLGNGPADWVQEYLITKEGGKMLGTLVALAVARMRSLETFVWDMPTGVLRDVWLSLSSLADRDDNQESRLQKVWVRWHDNTPSNSTMPPAPPYAIPPPLHLAGNSMMNLRPARQVRLEDLDHLEHPSFSILPALRSLSVLDVDELAYLDEMAVLVERSIDKLRELRVGIARHAITREWVTPWEGDDLQQVDYEEPTVGSLTIGEKRLGGVLGAITGLVHDLRKPRTLLPHRARRATSPKADTSIDAGRSGSDSNVHPPATSHSLMIGGEGRTDDSSTMLTLTPSDATLDNDPLVTSSRAASPQPPNTTDASSQAPVLEDVVESEEQSVKDDHGPQRQLQLETLELERIPLCIDVLRQAFDWSRLTSLTILHCQNHETLWKTLRKQFDPMQRSQTYSDRRRAASTSSKKGSRTSLPAVDMELPYLLNIKRVHTNTVSPALISFLKETLAPNSLEVLFLQEVRSYASSVTIESIFKGPMRRHRTSLKKLLMDSSERGIDGVPTSASRRRRWMLSREILTFICSGKMPRLRELGMAIEYKDWHFFLQHLPSVPQLRSLYIPFLADHPHGADVDPRELALQIVDIVALRPEVEICYMGIANKCFEILENQHGMETRPESHLDHLSNDLSSSDPEEDGDDADDELADDEDDIDDDDDAGDDTESDMSGDDGDSDIVEASNHARLRLREILFYDDKVAVFRARHGRL